MPVSTSISFFVFFVQNAPQVDMVSTVNIIVINVSTGCVTHRTDIVHTVVLKVLMATAVMHIFTNINNKNSNIDML